MSHVNFGTNFQNGPEIFGTNFQNWHRKYLAQFLRHFFPAFFLPRPIPAYPLPGTKNLPCEWQLTLFSLLFMDCEDGKWQKCHVEKNVGILFSSSFSPSFLPSYVPSALCSPSDTSLPRGEVAIVRHSEEDTEAKMQSFISTGS